MTSTLEVNHRRFIDEIWYSANSANYDVVDDVMHEDIVAHTPHGDLRGREAFKNLCRTYLSVFPDQTMEVHEFVAADNMTMVRWFSEGTHDGEAFMGIEPAGTKVSMTGLTMAYWDEDEQTMKEVWFAFDLLGVVTQLETPVDR